MSVVFVNTNGVDFHEILFIRLAASRVGASKKQIVAALDAQDFCPSGCFFDYIGGGAFGGPKTTSRSVGPDFQPGPVLLLKGRHVYVCFVTEDDGTPHTSSGCSAPSGLARSASRGECGPLARSAWAGAGDPLRHCDRVGVPYVSRNPSSSLREV